MSKNGFTLIELMAAFIIVALILAIVIPNVKDVITSNTEKLWKENENRLLDAAEKYLVVKKIKLPKTNGETLVITKDELIAEKLIKEIYNLNKKSEICDGYVNITNNNGLYAKKAFIVCTGGYQTQ